MLPLEVHHCWIVQHHHECHRVPARQSFVHADRQHFRSVDDNKKREWIDCSGLVLVNYKQLLPFLVTSIELVHFRGDWMKPTQNTIEKFSWLPLKLTWMFVTWPNFEKCSFSLSIVFISTGIFLTSRLKPFCYIMITQSWRNRCFDSPASLLWIQDCSWYLSRLSAALDLGQSVDDRWWTVWREWWKTKWRKWRHTERWHWR